MNMRNIKLTEVGRARTQILPFILKAECQASKVCSINFNHLLTTSGPLVTFSRLSTMRGCISTIELLQFTIVRSFWASLGEALFWEACHQDAIKLKKTHNCVGTEKF